MFVLLLKKTINFFRFRLLPDKLFLIYSFYKYHNYFMSFKNPKSLNEKIHWLKLYDRTKLHTQCADKIAVRKYVSDSIGDKYLIPIFKVIDDVSELTYFNLPEFPHIIKTNNGCGSNLVVQNKETLNFTTVQKNFNDYLRYNHYYITKEWQYKNISPKILIEKLLLNDDMSLPNDLKFHCFNGKVELIQLDIDRYSNNRRRNLYSRNWELLDFSWCPIKDGKPIWPNSNKVFEKPNNLNQMIKISEKLSLPFKYVRVDLYENKNNIYFGELTFHHGSGVELFTPRSADILIGELLQL